MDRPELDSANMICGSCDKQLKAIGGLPHKTMHIQYTFVCGTKIAKITMIAKPFPVVVCNLIIFVQLFEFIMFFICKH
jgi:hypothetical protein